MNIAYRIRSVITTSFQVMYFIIAVTFAFAAFELGHYVVLLVSAISSLFAFVNQGNWDRNHRLKYWAVCLLSFIMIFVIILIEVGIEMQNT